MYVPDEIKLKDTNCSIEPSFSLMRPGLWLLCAALAEGDSRRLIAFSNIIQRSLEETHQPITVWYSKNCPACEDLRRIDAAESG